MRYWIAGGTAVLLVCWLPADVESIRVGVEYEPGLALGISFKIVMHVLAVVGLVRDQTFGYAFLLGASLQGLLVAVGALTALSGAGLWAYRGQAVGPLLDILFRLASLGFLATRPGRMVGKEAGV